MMHGRFPFGVVCPTAMGGIVSVLLLFGAFNRQCLADEPAVLDKARDAILNLHYIKYSFRSIDVSALEGNTIDFISEGVKTKTSYSHSTGAAPNPHPRIFKGLSPRVMFCDDAYNGEFFQHYSTYVFESRPAGFYSFSRSMPLGDDSSYIGPCLNPLEGCYEWVSFNRPSGYRWKHMKDPEVWAELKPKRTMKISENGLTIHRLVFELKHGRDLTVDLVEDYNYFPVRTALGSDSDPDGESTLLQCSNFVKVDGRHFPTVVEKFYQTSPKSGFHKDRYEIIEESISFQRSNDLNEINIVPVAGDEVNDVDKREMSIFGKEGTSEKLPERK